MQSPTILLVDDEALLRDILVAEFADTGFDVVAARDGTRAIAELDADATRFKAVVTDIRLGEGPDGWDAGCHARKLATGDPTKMTTSSRRPIGWVFDQRLYANG